MRRVKIILLMLITVWLLVGCKENIYPQVATVGLEYQIAVNNGKIIFEGEYEDSKVFTELKNVRSVSAGLIHSAAVTKDGKVVILEGAVFNDFNIGDWEDIVAVEFTLFSIVGLKSDGNVVVEYCGGNENYNEEVAEISSWKDIVSIDCSQFGIVALDKNGNVYIEGGLIPEEEIREKIKSLNDIKSINCSMDYVVTVSNNGEVYAENLFFGHGFTNEAYEDLKGAKKICVGREYLIGLMPDNTTKVHYAQWHEESKPINEDAGFKEAVLSLFNRELVPVNTGTYDVFDGLINVVDINSYEDYVVALLEDGTIIAAGTNRHID